MHKRDDKPTMSWVAVVNGIGVGCFLAFFVWLGYHILAWSARSGLGQKYLALLG